jgi:hypothetical protein
VGSGKVERIAQIVHQQHARFDVALVRSAIHGDFDYSFHGLPSSAATVNKNAGKS